jgi:hypothetical protein
MSRFAAGASRLEYHRQNTFAVEMTYSRTLAYSPLSNLPSNITMSGPDGNGNMTVTATINGLATKPEYPLANVGGLDLTKMRWDFLFQISDLLPLFALTGLEQNPMRGDVVGATLNGNATSFPLAPTNAKVYEPSFNVNGNTWRVHANRMS